MWKNMENSGLLLNCNKSPQDERLEVNQCKLSHRLTSVAVIGRLLHRFNSISNQCVFPVLPYSFELLSGKALQIKRLGTNIVAVSLIVRVHILFIVGGKQLFVILFDYEISHIYFICSTRRTQTFSTSARVDLEKLKVYSTFYL